MKIRIEVDSNLQENEIILKCKEIDSQIIELQKNLSEEFITKQSILFYKGDTEFYFPLHKILFFETGNLGIIAHTKNDEFIVKYKLYELEELVPSYFIRVSKSTILNSREIYSITKNLTASSTVEFQNTHKKVYVSRNYFKTLKDMLSISRA